MSILSTIMGVETGGGHNIIQGNIGDINNRTGDLAKGYMQITNATWSDFGGLSTGFSQANQASYGQQIQVAMNIPVARWGPASQQALINAGYTPQPGETLGQMMARYGEDPGQTTAADGSTMSGSGSTIANGGTDTSSGVNAGLNSVSGNGAGSFPGAGNVSLSSVPSDQVPTNVIGLDKTATTAISDWIGNIEKAVGGAFTTALTAGLKSIGVDFGAIQNWFVRAGIILLGIVIIAVGLLGLFWDQGGKEIVRQYAPDLKFA